MTDQGSEFASKTPEQWDYENAMKLELIQLDKSTKNGLIESFNAKFRDDYLNVHRLSAWW